MAYSHILITRPRQEGAELAEMLSSCGAETIALPAYEFYGMKLFSDQVGDLQQATLGSRQPLLVFTSPRSVQYGLNQIPQDVISRVRIAAIGASTAKVLEKSGAHVTLRPEQGYTSEDLLETLARQGGDRNGFARPAFIVTAPGGRTALSEGLQAQGFEPRMLMVYGRRPAEIPPAAVTAIQHAETLLSIWTSASAVNTLFQRLPSACWARLCRGDWLVISERLRRLARTFSPAHIFLADGPANPDILEAIQRLDNR